jgi:hypothetical protein
MADVIKHFRRGGKRERLRVEQPGGEIRAVKKCAAANTGGQPTARPFYFSGNGEPVGGEAGLGKPVGEVRIVQRLNAAISEANISCSIVTGSCPRNGCVRRNLQQARFDRNAADFKIVITGKQRLWMICVRIQADKVTNTNSL